MENIKNINSIDFVGQFDIPNIITYAYYSNFFDAVPPQTRYLFPYTLTNSHPSLTLSLNSVTVALDARRRT